MPTTLTHKIAADNILEKLTDPQAKKIITENLPAYYSGSQGGDIFPVRRENEDARLGFALYAAAALFLRGRGIYQGTGERYAEKLFLRLYHALLPRYVPASAHQRGNKANVQS